MCMSDGSPRLILARNYVRTVTWEKPIPYKFYIAQELENFPGLVQLCLWSNFFHTDQASLVLRANISRSLGFIHLYGDWQHVYTDYPTSPQMVSTLLSG